jgi:hypothetical protein
LDYWRKLIDKIGNLHRDRGMMIFLIAHAKVEKFEDPEAPAYDRYSPRLHKHASAIITEWCDAVLFATKRFTTRTEESGFGRQRAIAAPVGAAGGDIAVSIVATAIAQDWRTPAKCNYATNGIFCFRSN